VIEPPLRMVGELLERAEATPNQAPPHAAARTDGDESGGSRMSIFITGGTGYLGSYVVTRLVEVHDARCLLMVRAKTRKDAIAKLWSGLQMHMDAARFRRALDKIEFVEGDLTAPRLGMSEADRKRVADGADSCCTSRHHSIARAKKRA